MCLLRWRLLELGILTWMRKRGASAAAASEMPAGEQTSCLGAFGALSVEVVELEVLVEELVEVVVLVEVKRLVELEEVVER